MTDSKQFIQARTIVRHRLRAYALAPVEPTDTRFRNLHHALEAILNADLNATVLQEALDLAEQFRRAEDGALDLIGATHRNPDFHNMRADVLLAIDDNLDAAIRRLLTDRVLGEYTAREVSA